MSYSPSPRIPRTQEVLRGTLIQSKSNLPCTNRKTESSADCMKESLVEGWAKDQNPGLLPSPQALRGLGKNTNRDKILYQENGET